MNGFLELRTKLVLLYQKADFIIRPMFKFLLALLALVRLRNMFNYNDLLTSNIAALLISLAAAFVPMSMTLAIMFVYIALLLQPVSVMMSILPIAVYLVLYCFFLRMIPEYSVAVIAMPLLLTWRLPYVIPMAIGLFFTPLGIIPTCAGVFTYYLLKNINTSMVTIEQVSSKENPLQIVSDTMNKVIKDEDMFAIMAVFTLIIVVMFLIRNIRMDYSFEISIAIGAAVSAISFFVLLLRMDIGMGVMEIILSSVLSALIMYVAYFLYRPLFYAGTERVRFEDDDYYYYVRAVPKIKILGADAGGRKLIIDPSLDDEEEDEDNEAEENAEDDNVFGINRTAEDEQDDF